MDYDDSDGIVLHTVHSCATDAAEPIRGFDTSVYPDPQTNRRLKQLAGMLSDGMDLNWIGSYILDPDVATPVKSHLVTQDYCWGNPVYAYRNMTLQQPNHVEDLYWIFYGGWEELLPQYVKDLYADYPYRTLAVDEVLQANRDGQPTTLCRVHVERHRNEQGTLDLQLTTPDVYHFPAGHFANSPQFVPRQGSEQGTEGYLVCVVFADRPDGSSTSELWIFDTAHLSQGPQYRLCSDRMTIGFTIHTTWIPEAVSPTDVQYNIREDYEPVVADLVKRHQQSWFPGQRKVGQDLRSLFDRIYQQFGQ
ncbi:MAG: carotenoid oxygenase family protein [Thermosynechococcaceae cyanobacterium]